MSEERHSTLGIHGAGSGDAGELLKRRPDVREAEARVAALEKELADPGFSVARAKAAAGISDQRTAWSFPDGSVKMKLLRLL